MPDETDRKMMEILRILADQNKVLGAKTIAEELKKKGYVLGERAVRYHMRILDEKGFTKRIGYAGRQITDKGLRELDKGLIYDQVDFAFSKFEGMIYQTSLDPAKGVGTVVVNTSSFLYENEVMDIIKKVFKMGVAVSPHIRITDLNSDEFKKHREVEVETICGTTIDGMLLKEGIPVIPQYGGIVKIKDFTPKRFSELIAYKKTYMTPLEAFTAKDMTSVLKVVETGNGTIPANFRLIPAAAREHTLDLFERLRKIGIFGLLRIGENGESVLGIPVEKDMVGIAIIGGIAPLCAVKEAGFSVDIKLAEKIIEFSKTEKIVDSKQILKTTGPGTSEKVKFLLSEAWNLIYNVDLDIESCQGNVIANISYVNREYLEDSLEIMNSIIKKRPEYCTSPYFKIIPYKNKKAGIATVCSLTVDGILIKNGVLTVPQYGGILEIEEREPRFVELTAYSGSSLDPHEIYISKDMTSVSNAVNGKGRILASLKEIPYIARPETIEILQKIEELGFSILKVGETSELVYNAKVERYHVGVVSPGGLNPIAAIKEHGIPVEVKAVETMMDLRDMEEF